MDNPQPDMDNPQPRTDYDAKFVRNMVESALRVGLVVILLLLSYDIIKPFTTPILWGAIIAMAAFPLVKWLEPKLGGRRGLASSLVCVVFILLLVVPTYSVTDAVVGGIKNLVVKLEDGTLEIPPPSDKVRDWPIIGERAHAGGAKRAPTLRHSPGTTPSKSRMSVAGSSDASAAACWMC